MKGNTTRFLLAVALFIMLSGGQLFNNSSKNTANTKTTVDFKSVEIKETQGCTFPWQMEDNGEKRIGDIPLPGGYKRIDLVKDSFAEYLRSLPLKETDIVYLFNRQKKGRQDVQYAVVDIDTGNKDLQQCADAVMRLRAEYLYSCKKYSKISFNFVSGFRCDFATWSNGNKVRIARDKASWVPANNDGSYTSFRRYMNVVFSYANTSSLEKEITPIADLDDIQAGDVFVQGGFPGHAVLVLDVAENKKGEVIFLLGQSYMPAQDFHVLKSFEDISPWYVLDENAVVSTPEWNFFPSDLMRF